MTHFLSQSGFSDTLDCLDHALRGVFGLEIVRGCDSRMQKSRLSEDCVPDHVILSHRLINCHLHSCQHSRTQPAETSQRLWSSEFKILGLPSCTRSRNVVKVMMWLELSRRMLKCFVNTSCNSLRGFLVHDSDRVTVGAWWSVPRIVCATLIRNASAIFTSAVKLNEDLLGSSPFRSILYIPSSTVVYVQVRSAPRET